jgi:hypothetical protein
MLLRRHTINEIVRILEDPNEHWVFCEYRATHSSGVSLWIANGMLRVDISEPTKIGMRFIERWRVWRAVRIAQSHCVFRQLQKQVDDAKANTTQAN